MTWRSIKDDPPPKDGTVILLGGGKIYCEERFGYITGPQVAAWVKDGHHGDWLIAAAESGYVWICYDDPTVWMPLDDLPPLPA